MTESGRARAGCGLLIRSLLTLAAVLMGVLAPARVRAAPYDVFIDVDDEDDLYELAAAGLIEEEDIDDLIYLLDRGVDLQTATREQIYALPNLTYADVDRILAYRDEVGVIADPAALVLADVIDAKTLQAIAPFLVVSTRDKTPVDARGFVRYRTMWSAEDRQVPPMVLQAGVTTLRHLTIGGTMLVERTRPAPVIYDPNRDALISDGLQPSVRAAKYYAAWEAPHWGIIVGTYNIGFGQRLVFDSTGRYTPNGFVRDDIIYRRTRLRRLCKESRGELDSTEDPCPGERNVYTTPDYRIREGLRGVALGTNRIELPTGWAQAYGFFSYQTRSLYQDYLSRCVDGDCKRPPIYVRPSGDPLDHATTLTQVTIPNAYNEILGGANLGYYYNRRTHVGFTGYGADVQWLMRGIDVDFSRSSRYPSGGPWGAVGADFAWGRKWADIFFEFAYAFDSTSPGTRGGPAAILRHTATWNTHELEVSGRYYDPGFSNPYARPINQPDQYQGNRARDETGVQLRYSGILFRIWSLKARLDGWGSPRGGKPGVQAHLRSDVRALPWFLPGAWIRYRASRVGPAALDDYDVVTGPDGIGLVSAEGEACYGIGESDNPDAASGGCTNGLRIGGRGRFDVHKRVYFTVQYQHAFVGSRQDMTSAVQLGARPIDSIRLQFRVRHYDFNIKDNSRGENSVWAYAQVTYAARRWLMPTLRYDVRAWVDRRNSTALRSPNPEHWLLFQLESRF